jgi:hypothetical protein
MRQMLPGVEGEPVTLVLGDTVRKEYDFQVRPFWSRTKLGVVALVQNGSTREVLQAACLSRIEPQRRFR